MYRPAAFAISQICVDIPLVIMQILLFSVCLYFMAGLQRTFVKWLLFCVILFLCALCMTAFFRMVITQESFISTYWLPWSVNSTTYS